MVYRKVGGSSLFCSSTYKVLSIDISEENFKHDALA